MILKIREGFWINLDLVDQFEWFEESKGNCYFELRMGDNFEKVTEANALEAIFKYLKSPRIIE